MTTQTTATYTDEYGVTWTYEDAGATMQWRYRAYRGDVPGAYYCTNREGRGLFYNNGRGNVHQVSGTSQFKVRSLADFRRQFPARRS